MPGAVNDVTARKGRWRQFPGDAWACFEALPPTIRQRLHEHAYDAWSVNALKLWRRFRRTRDTRERAERALLRYLDCCEALEREMFDAGHRRAYGVPMPHVAAGASVMRYRRQATVLAAGVTAAPTPCDAATPHAGQNGMATGCPSGQGQDVQVRLARNGHVVRACR